MLPVLDESDRGFATSIEIVDFSNKGYMDDIVIGMHDSSLVFYRWESFDHKYEVVDVKYLKHYIYKLHMLRYKE